MRVEDKFTPTVDFCCYNTCNEVYGRIINIVTKEELTRIIKTLYKQTSRR